MILTDLSSLSAEESSSEDTASDYTPGAPKKGKQVAILPSAKQYSHYWAQSRALHATDDGDGE